MPENSLATLLQHATTRFDSVILEWTIDRDDALLDSALRRRIRSQSGSAVALLPEGTANGALPDAGHTAHGKLWWRKPSSWRDEESVNGFGSMVRILDDTRYVGYMSRAALVRTNIPPGLHHPIWPELPVESRPDLAPYSLRMLLREVPLVDPSFLVNTCELTFEGTDVYLNREVVKVKAARRSPECRAFFRASEHEYRLLVDAETGILLRYAVMVEEREAWLLNVTAIKVNSAIADQVFAFQPPEGTKVKLTA